MPTRLWQALAVTFAIFALIVALTDALNPQQYTDDGLGTGSVADDGFAPVLSVTGAAAAAGTIHLGDRIRPAGGRFTPRYKLSNWPAGTVLRWTVRRGTSEFAAITTVAAPAFDDVVFAEAVNAFRLAVLAVALLIAVRRPDAPEARALTVFLATLGLAAFSVPPWLPEPLLRVAAAVRSPLILIGLGYAVLFGCLFPAASASGVRAVIRRAAMPLAYAAAAAALAISLASFVFERPLPHAQFLGTLVSDVSYALIAMIALAFVLGTIAAGGDDRRRAMWATGSMLVGFSGIVVAIVAQSVLPTYPPWVNYVQLTVFVIPLGLAYTILRHRTIDIGFVISRALVLTVVSFIIVAAFGLLERALGKLFIDMSHIASRTVEIALAIGLGFSLRTLHVRVERTVDYVFFRGRQRALAALRAFAHDVYYINDESLVVGRTIEVVATNADAAHVAVVRRAVAESDDPLYVRLRAGREAAKLSDTGTAVAGEIAFPMVVRGDLTGALIVAAKRTGETYDPEERAILAEIAERVGFALDALETLSIRRELDALRAATGGAVPAL